MRKRGYRGLPWLKRGEPQDRQQAANVCARARRKPARWCKTTRSEQEVPRAWLPLAEGTLCMGTNDLDSRRGCGNPTGGLWEWTRAVPPSSRGDQVGAPRRRTGLLGGEAPRVVDGGAVAARRAARCARVRTPGEEDRGAFARHGPGTEEGLWRGARDQEGRRRSDAARRRVGVEARRKSSRARRRRPGANPDVVGKVEEGAGKGQRARYVSLRGSTTDGQPSAGPATSRSG